MRNKILVLIAGPTAVGKTALAIDIAQKYATEVISADSRQIYREMEIGTAKPDQNELRQVPHHFISSHSIHDAYNAGKFEIDASAVLTHLFQKNDIVVMAGGSGLYINALLDGLNDMPEVDPEVREALNLLFKKEGLDVLQKELKEKDPLYFSQVDIQNPVRLIRALEVIRTSGKPYSSFRSQEKKKNSFHVIKIALDRNRDELYERIDQRMDIMLDAGLETEAKQLYPYRHLNSLQTVGYSEIFDFLEGKYDREEMIRLLKRNSRNYAKRQLTWFRKDKTYAWFDPQSKEEIFKFIDEQIGALRN